MENTTENELSMHAMCVEVLPVSPSNDELAAQGGGGHKQKKTDLGNRNTGSTTREELFALVDKLEDMLESAVGHCDEDVMNNLRDLIHKHVS